MKPQARNQLKSILFLSLAAVAVMIFLQKKLPTKACISFNQKIASEAPEDLLQQLKDGKLLLPRQCPTDPETTLLFESMTKLCSPQALSENVDCRTGLINYRERIIFLLSAGPNDQHK